MWASGRQSPGPKARYAEALGLRKKRVVALFTICALFLSLTAKLFVWPARDPVDGEHADAVLVMNGPGHRWELASRLAAGGAAPVFLISTGSVQWDCPRYRFPSVQVICFRPDPFNTRGEARFAAQQARLHHWKSLIVVSSVPQATRARLRVKRCFHGVVKVVPASPTNLAEWAYGVIYEWGALAKALVWQRSC